MTSRFAFPAVELTPALQELRLDVRAFLADEARSGGFVVAPGGWKRFDPEFSRKVAKRGWVGMAIPCEYGGHGRSALERYVVNEELLTAGAPVWAHWIADRQVAPGIVLFGSETQKKSILPRIAAADCPFSVGFSEPDTGSDLSSVRTTAVQVPGGWRINGRKIWTTDAHRMAMIVVLARTAPSSGARQDGLTQFILDGNTPGISVTPIMNLADEHDFNEVLFEDVFATDDAVLGAAGGAWQQVTTDLANERSGPERWLSTYQLFLELVSRLEVDASDSARRDVGRLFAHLWTLREMSLSVAGMLMRGENPVTEASIVKDMGTAFEQEIPEVARRLISEGELALLGSNHPIADHLNYDILHSPIYTIRGGTREILRGIIARGLGLR
jgi:acyl-CoA dehydrogenase